ncbi:sigma-70 family RNA polymerase sigma factor [Carboxylicivirga marina]|uniref:Sigma-70 family RNA polymerase sigma factor n=2 Tax=Carboxylicivirga marina TaxID=2800988 RepID=A0ABS1HQ75_9BACT|nr:sigma-70 family RNA polymerase sigma factor [Carboxylicivirga marina]MBK3519697.1 sigma-70 family RNA polymerase sigma factor [Carboxylicivirga marina]
MEIQIDTLYKSLYIFIKNRINNNADAQDITQDVFLKLSSSNTEEVKNLKSWMFTVAKNSIIDYYRKNNYHYNSEELPYTEDNDNNTVAVEELSTCMLTFINQLPADYKELMLLSEINNMPQKEIAEQLGINYATVRSKVQRGRDKLKKLFTDCCNIEQDARNSIIDYEEKTNSCQSDPYDCSDKNDKC